MEWLWESFSLARATLADVRASWEKPVGTREYSMTLGAWLSATEISSFNQQLPSLFFPDTIP